MTKNTLADVAILSLADFERIRKNAAGLTKEEEKNQRKILEEQKDIQQLNAKSRKEKLQDFDKTRTDRYAISDIDRENMDKNNTLLYQAKKMLDEDHDAVKDMNKMVLYAKVATIRDRQLEEQKYIQYEYKKQNVKMDLLMELERLKELKFQEDREKTRKDQQRVGSMIIIDQIKERDLDRLKQKDQLDRERLLMLKQIKELEEEDVKIAEIKKDQAAKLAKEVEKTNVRAISEKEKKKIEEREVDFKIYQYNLEKTKKEEEDLAEKL